MREGDLVGRLGGDEFLAICPSVVSAAQAMEIAKRVSAALATSVDIGTHTIDLRASVGVVWTMERIDTDTLIALADSAMYESKRLGDHGVILYEAANTDVTAAGDVDESSLHPDRREIATKRSIATAGTAPPKGDAASGG